MGGLMSGFQGIRKLTTAEVCSLDIKCINIKRRVSFSGTISWNKSSTISIKKMNEDKVVFQYINTINGIAKDYNYKVGLDYTTCNYGGERAWFICPDCWKRVRKLYLKRGVFKCRNCQNLNYIIQQEDKRDYIMRSIDHKMYKIQDRLKTKRDWENVFRIEKPKWMHYKTYYKLISELNDLYIQRNKAFIRILRGYKTGALKNLTI